MYIVLNTIIIDKKGRSIRIRIETNKASKIGTSRRNKKGRSIRIRIETRINSGDARKWISNKKGRSIRIRIETFPKLRALASRVSIKKEDPLE